MKQNASWRIYIFLGWLAIGLAVVALILTGWIWLPEKTDFNKIGPLGDWVAGITAPFMSLAGFFILYVAFRKQTADQEKGRQEFHLQRFEHTFFQLLNLHHQNVNAIRQQYEKKAHEDFFEASRLFLSKQAGSNPIWDDVLVVYERFYERNFNLIDHFVRHVLFSLQTIHQSQAFVHLPEKEAAQFRSRYAAMLGAQLSADEACLLFYHIACDPTDASKPFLPLIIQYQFFSPNQMSRMLLAGDHWDAFVRHISTEDAKKP